MSGTRKILFAVVTLLALLGIVEALSRFVWWRLEERSFRLTLRGADGVLRNDAINFMKQPDGELGYVLRPGFNRGGLYVSEQGLAQRDLVAAGKQPQALRIAAMGESTTQGHNVDSANYPEYLKKLLRAQGEGYAAVEMVNGGVAGWISDQVARWAEKKIAPLEPDVVILYAGWNDFQTYDPYQLPPIRSYFYDAYGGTAYVVESSHLKTISLLSAGYERLRLRRLEQNDKARRAEFAARKSRDYATAADENYKFYLQSMDRIVAAFRSRNPKVRIAVSTLVGRWPDGTRAAYDAEQGAVWWMKSRGLAPEEAASAMRRFNEVVRKYARSRGLFLIDAEAAFAGMDRARLQHDFAHFGPEGYELLAEVMYEEMRSGGIVAGRPSSRLNALKLKYAAAKAARPDNASTQEPK